MIASPKQAPVGLHCKCKAAEEDCDPGTPGVQMHRSKVDLLFECILIRDGPAALPCWFPRSDVRLSTRPIYIAPCEVSFVFLFFLSFFRVFFALFFVYLGTINIINNE